MKLHSLLVISCALCLSSVQGIPPTYAQAQTTAGGPEKIKALLLRPIGWVVEWNAGQWGTGEGGFIYETRGDKVVVVIENFDNPIWSCERDVTFTADGFTHDGCRDNDVKFRFDPDDPDYPFKGGGGGLKVDYRLKAKW